MGIFSKIFKGKESASDKGWRVGGMEDFITLIRVYYQAVMAANLGISNISALPDLRVFKQTLHVPTLNNKLGLGEKNKCKKMLQEIYGISDDFFKEIEMTYHSQNSWKDYGFKSADKGQEFVFTPNAEALDWIKDIIK
jgi:hypothetical protein